MLFDEATTKEDGAQDIDLQSQFQLNKKLKKERKFCWFI